MALFYAQKTGGTPGPLGKDPLCLTWFDISPLGAGEKEAMPGKQKKEEDPRPIRLWRIDLSLGER